MSREAATTATLLITAREALEKFVEVRVDDGPWEPATLGPDGGIDYWRQWYHPWQATSGRHTLWCRATDLTGATQPETRADPFPRGATGWHNIVVNIG